MRYHNITKDDMLNGDGLRVVLWVAGCSHCCKECQNPITWDPAGGLLFDEAAKQEIFEQLEKHSKSVNTLGAIILLTDTKFVQLLNEFIIEVTLGNSNVPIFLIFVLPFKLSNVVTLFIFKYSISVI